MKTDYLIIGSGIAGLSVAIKLAEQFPERKIIIVTKSSKEESNTQYAQGGIAVVMDKINDHFEKHIEDTLICGDGLCNREVVEWVVTEGPKRLQELMDWGTQFDRAEDGTLDLGKEGGHSYHRVVHHKDQTGKEIERVVLAKAHRHKNIQFLDYHFAVDLLVFDNGCKGALVLNERIGKQFAIYAGFTILATGGIGQLYRKTTNSVIATGDGIAMAIRVNAEVNDMEFIQFHPTALYSKAAHTFLISEAVRGFGAYLINKNGHRFLFDYDSRGELASRDIVSRSIAAELKKSGDDCVFLDTTHLDQNAFKKHFPAIAAHCLTEGIDVSVDWIPVIPVQHYLCGGITVNGNGQTSVENLFACGECSRTGLHGANRLASNSLLEAVVYAHRIFCFLKDTELLAVPFTSVSKEQFKEYQIPAEFIMERDSVLKNLIQQNVGIVRNMEDLEDTLRQLILWRDECERISQNHHLPKEFMELRNKITVAVSLVTASLNRTENKGCFFKEDTARFK